MNKSCIRAASWALLCAAAPALANPALEAGRQVFTGAQPLVAHMPGHSQALPVAAARCSNCHAAPGLPASGASSLGPRLNAGQLMQPQARRGGPLSRYDAASLCRVLREGVDPAGVVLASAMPRYTVDDATCRQLWTFLTADLK
jgi:cytochrome c5